jgi:hypothetical protein
VAPSNNILIAVAELPTLVPGLASRADAGRSDPLDAAARTAGAATNETAKKIAAKEVSAITLRGMVRRLQDF